jgi:hypothetical protein
MVGRPVGRLAWFVFGHSFEFLLEPLLRTKQDRPPDFLEERRMKNAARIYHREGLICFFLALAISVVFGSRSSAILQN